MEQNYFQKEIETMPLEELRKLQSEKLVKQVRHVYENVEYYRNLMDEKGESSDYYYYILNPETRTSDFSKTLGEHEQKVQKYYGGNG